MLSLTVKPPRHLRLSLLVRLLWIAMAALHAWLVVRRFAAGDWGQWLDFLKAALALAAIGYCTLKVWLVATVFDRGPRRAWVFAFVLLLGHWMLKAPEGSEVPLGAIPVAALSLSTTLPAVSALILLVGVAGGLILHTMLTRPELGRTQLLLRHSLTAFPVHDRLPAALRGSPPSLFRRPPPCFA